MKDLEVIAMVSGGLKTICEQLSSIGLSLERIEKLMSYPQSEDSVQSICPANGVTENISGNEKLNKMQAARILGVSAKTLDRYRKLGVIPFSQINRGKVSFKYKDIVALRDKVREPNRHGNYFSNLIMDVDD